MKRLGLRLLGAFAVIAFVAVAFGLVSNTALADPGGGQVVIPQDLTINSPPATIDQVTPAFNPSPPAAPVVNLKSVQTAPAIINTSPHTIMITANTQSTAGGTAEGQAINNTSIVNQSAGTTITIGGNDDVICPTITVQADNNDINTTITATTVTLNTCANELALTNERLDRCGTELATSSLITIANEFAPG